MTMIIAAAERRPLRGRSGGHAERPHSFSAPVLPPGSALPPASPGFPGDVASLEEAADHGGRARLPLVGPVLIFRWGSGEGATVQSDIKKEHFQKGTCFRRARERRRPEGPWRRQNGSAALVSVKVRGSDVEGKEHTDTHSSHHHLHSRFLKSSHISVTIATLLSPSLFHSCFFSLFLKRKKIHHSLSYSLSL